LIGRDTLKLHSPPKSASFWLVRDATPNMASYFSQSSVAEGKSAAYAGSDQRSDKPAATWLAPPFVGLSRLYAPSRDAGAAAVASAADRSADIPDEIYTLW
jgi:hypothetical protein